MAAGLTIAVPMTCLMQTERERLAVSAGRFQAGVNALDTLLGEPLLKLLEARRTVGEDFVLEFAILIDEADIEL
jgi:hypothetical protein